MKPKINMVWMWVVVVIIINIVIFYFLSIKLEKYVVDVLGSKDPLEVLKL